MGVGGGGGQPQHCKMHLFSELIDVGSQFVFKKKGKLLFIKSTVVRI